MQVRSHKSLFNYSLTLLILIGMITLFSACNTNANNEPTPRSETDLFSGPYSADTIIEETVKLEPVGIRTFSLQQLDKLPPIVEFSGVHKGKPFKGIGISNESDINLWEQAIEFKIRGFRVEIDGIPVMLGQAAVKDVSETGINTQGLLSSPMGVALIPANAKLSSSLDVGSLVEIMDTADYKATQLRDMEIILRITANDDWEAPVLGIVSPRDPASGLPTGKRQAKGTGKLDISGQVIETHIGSVAVATGNWFWDGETNEGNTQKIIAILIG